MGISYFPNTKYNIDTKLLFGKPSYSGHEATFNFAINLYTMNMIRTLGRLSSSKLKYVTANLNIGKSEFCKNACTCMYIYRVPSQGGSRCITPNIITKQLTSFNIKKIVTI